MLKPHTTFLTWSILKRNSWGTHGARLGKSHCIGSVVEVAGLQLRCITVQRQPSVRGQIASRSCRVTSGGTCATKLLPIHLWSHVNCKLQSMVGTYWHMSEQVSVWLEMFEQVGLSLLMLFFNVFSSFSFGSFGLGTWHTVAPSFLHVSTVSRRLAQNQARQTHWRNEPQSTWRVMKA